jgi:similar to stage IV sporulation protein
MALFVAAHLFVWDVEVEGNETVGAEEIRAELAAAGLSRGTFLPNLDREAVAIALRRGDARIAFAVVNLRGTVAHVQIREASRVPQETAPLPANLVAKCDGVITLPLIFEGECLVSEGEVVRAGQILAGGVIDSEKHGYRITRAAGQIMARTTNVLTVRAPLTFEETVDGGVCGREISLFFFGFEQKVFKNSGNGVGNCDIIESIYRPRVSKDGDLPFGIRHVEYRERVTVTKTRTAREAIDAAERELAALLADSGELGTVLEKHVETVADAEGVTLICTVVSERDIASVVEFSLDKQ